MSTEPDVPERGLVKCVVEDGMRDLGEGCRALAYTALLAYWDERDGLLRELEDYWRDRFPGTELTPIVEMADRRLLKEAWPDDPAIAAMPDDPRDDPE